MVTKYVSRPMGMGRGAGTLQDCMVMGCNVHQPKLWIASVLSAGVGLGASLLGGASARRAQRRAERRQREYENRRDALINRQLHESYVDTAAGQNLVRMAKDHSREYVKRAEGAAAVGGGTDAATAMAKEQGNKMVGDAIANIAAQDTARHDAAVKMKLGAESESAQMDMAREQARAQAISDVAGAASNAIMSVGGAIDQASAAKPSLNGGNNKGAAFNPPQVERPVDTPKSPMETYQHATDEERRHFEAAFGA